MIWRTIFGVIQIVPRCKDIKDIFNAFRIAIELAKPILVFIHCLQLGTLTQTDQILVRPLVVFPLMFKSFNIPIRKGMLLHFLKNLSMIYLSM